MKYCLLLLFKKKGSSEAVSVIVAKVVVSACFGLSCGKDRTVIEQLWAKYLCILLLGHLLARKEN